MKLHHIDRTIGVALLAAALGCATAGKRIPDSPREKLGGMPVPDPVADRDLQDQRFGIDSARERGDTMAQKRAERRRCADIIAGKAPNRGPPCYAVPLTRQ